MASPTSSSTPTAGDEALARLISQADIEAARSGDDRYYAGKAVKAEPVPIYASAEPEPVYYGTWQPPVERRIVYEEDPLEVWFVCLCLFFWFFFLVILIASISYYPTNDDRS